jgi:hypothetical protein
MSEFYLLKTKRYKRHFICFKCRKNFKQPNEKDLAEPKGELSLLLNAFYYANPKKKITKDIVQYLKDKYFNKKISCPECKHPMTEVSLSFKTPSKKDIKKWKILESFYNAEGFVTNRLPNNIKQLIIVLEKSLDWHIKMLQNVEFHKGTWETMADAENRHRTDIQNIRNELEILKQKK